MKIIVAVIGLMALSTGVVCQMPTVRFNAQKMHFDDGGKLPAAKAFSVAVDAGTEIDQVKLQISAASFDKNKILYESEWKRRNGDKGITAFIPNYYKLRSGRDYNLRFLFYRKVTETERKQMNEMLLGSATSVLQTSIKEKENKWKFVASVDEVYAALNSMLEDGMINYSTKTDLAKPAFSGIIENMLRALPKSWSAADTSFESGNKTMNALQNQLINELEMLANNYAYVIAETITVADYPVERSFNSLAVNVGYAGIYKSGGISDVDYFSGPYAGISIPLGNKVFSGRFWHNASLSAGIFLKDFVVSDSVKFTGPVVQKPIYVAFGYRVFKYLRFQAGTTIMEEVNTNTNVKSVQFKPFIGLSLELNLWLGLDKK